MSYKVNSFISCNKEVPSYEKNLSICLGTNGFSFSITSVRDEFLGFGEVSFDPNPSMSDAMTMIRGSFSDCGIATLGMHSVELVVMSEHFVWIPDHLYEPGYDRKYLDPLCKVPTGMGVFCDHNDQIGAYLVFTSGTTISAAFKIALPGLKIRCQHSKLVNPTLINRSDLRSILVLHIREKRLDVTVYCNKKLQMSNTFDAANLQEVTYHALNVMKQLHLEDALMEMLVCGDVDRAHYAQLSHYFPNSDLYVGRPLTKPNQELHELPAYRHALILS